MIRRTLAAAGDMYALAKIAEQEEPDLSTFAEKEE